MKFPNKLFEYKETVIYDCTIIMKKMTDNVSVLDLYKACSRDCDGVQGFFDALDVLYALNKISYDYKLRRISRVKGDSVQSI